MDKIWKMKLDGVQVLQHNVMLRPLPSGKILIDVESTVEVEGQNKPMNFTAARMSLTNSEEDIRATMSLIGQVLDGIVWAAKENVKLVKKSYKPKFLSHSTLPLFEESSDSSEDSFFDAIDEDLEGFFEDFDED